MNNFSCQNNCNTYHNVIPALLPPSFPRRRESIVNFVISHFRTVDSRLRGNDEYTLFKSNLVYVIKKRYLCRLKGIIGNQICIIKEF